MQCISPSQNQHENLSKVGTVTSTPQTRIKTLGATERKSSPQQIHRHKSTVAFWCPARTCHSPPVHRHLSPSVRQTGQKDSPPLPPPSICYHLSFSTSCWGVGGGRPRAGHPVRGLLTVPGPSAGAYWREIHINTYLLCLPPLDTAGLPAWHRQHCMGLLSRQRGTGFQCKRGTSSTALLSVLLLHWWTQGDNAEFEKAHFLVLLVSLIPSVVSLDHIWPAEFTACRFLRHAERKEAMQRWRESVWGSRHMGDNCDVEGVWRVCRDSQYALWKQCSLSLFLSLSLSIHPFLQYILFSSLKVSCFKVKMLLTFTKCYTFILVGACSDFSVSHPHWLRV